MSRYERFLFHFFPPTVSVYRIINFFFFPNIFTYTCAFCITKTQLNFVPATAQKNGNYYRSNNSSVMIIILRTTCGTRIFSSLKHHHHRPSSAAPPKCILRTVTGNSAVVVIIVPVRFACPPPGRIAHVRAHVRSTAERITRTRGCVSVTVLPRYRFACATQVQHAFRRGRRSRARPPVHNPRAAHYRSRGVAERPR